MIPSMHLWPVAVLVALLVPASALAQEPVEPLPPDAVAVVADKAITRTTFDTWLGVAARAERAVYDPPEFERCVAAKLRIGAHPHLHGDRARLRRRCARDYRVVAGHVMQFLIESEWIQAEAALQGIAVSDERVRRELEHQKRVTFESEREYRRFLRKSGMTEEMVLFRVRIDLVQERLTARVARQIEPTRDPLVRARRRQRAITRYITEFRARWASLTACAPGYLVRECEAARSGPQALR
jgi:hypothetical protein